MIGIRACCVMLGDVKRPYKLEQPADYFRFSGCMLWESHFSRGCAVSFDRILLKN